MEIKNTKVSIVRNENDIYSAVKEAIDLIGGMDSVIENGDRVLIKPNLAYPFPPPATTHPEIVEAVVKLCFQAGAGEVGIGDSTSYVFKDILGSGATTSAVFNEIADVGDSTQGVDKWCNRVILEKTKMVDVAQRTGAKIHDFDEEEWTDVVIEDGIVLRKVQIASAVMEADKVINLPALKTHFETGVTLGIKNYHGIIPDWYKIQYHKDDINQKLVDIHKAVKTHLTLIDGLIGMEGMGPGMGEPIEMGLIMASKDIVALDTVASTVMGYNPDEIETTRLADEQGIGTMNMDAIHVIGEQIQDVRKVFKRPDLRLGGIHKGVKVIKGGPCVHCYGRARNLLDSLYKMGIPEYGGIKTLIVGIKPHIPDLDEVDGDVVIVGDCAIESADNLRYGLGKRAYLMHGCPPIPSLHKVLDEIKAKHDG